MSQLSERVAQLESDLKQLRREKRQKEFQVSVGDSTGKQMTAAPVAWIVAMLATMSSEQREKVMQRVAKMQTPPPGSHILMPNGGVNMGGLIG